MPKRKSTTRTFDDRFADEMAESFGDLHKLGMIDDDAYKLTLRDLNREGGEAVIAPVSAGEIRALRENGPCGGFDAFVAARRARPALPRRRRSSWSVAQSTLTSQAATRRRSLAWRCELKS